jgi:hypothetical protein
MPGVPLRVSPAAVATVLHSPRVRPTPPELQAKEAAEVKELRRKLAEFTRARPVPDLSRPFAVNYDLVKPPTTPQPFCLNTELRQYQDNRWAARPARGAATGTGAASRGVPVSQRG